MTHGAGMPATIPRALPMPDNATAPYTTYERPPPRGGRDVHGSTARAGDRCARHPEVRGRRRSLRRAAARPPRRSPHAARPGMRYVAWAGRPGSASRDPVPDQRADPGGQDRRRRRAGARRGGARCRSPNTILVLGSDARPRGTDEGRRERRRRAEPLGHDPAPARRRRRQRPPLDPARHRRRHPRPRARQDQRRLRDRRCGAVDHDDQGLPRHRHQPRDRGQLRELPRSSSTRWAGSTCAPAACAPSSTAATPTAAHDRPEARRPPPRRPAARSASRACAATTCDAERERPRRAPAASRRS